MTNSGKTAAYPIPMILNMLSVLHYKNIIQAKFNCSRKLNCFFGNNGMGKTNLLDAIYFLSFCKSHLHTPDGQLINQIEDVCVIEGNYEVEGQIEEIFCAMKRGQRKMFKRNQKTYEKLSEHIGLMPLVIVSPADSELISGGSDTRRRLLDLMISQRDKNYLHALIQYNKALAQRNQLLRNQSQESTLFDVLEMQLGNYGQTIFDKRAQMVRTFIPLFNEYYQFICQSAEEVNLKYVSTLEDGGLEGKLAASRERDYLIGFTSQGVHKDDVEMTLGERLIRHSGSQGQNKTFLIALNSPSSPCSPIKAAPNLSSCSTIFLINSMPNALRKSSNSLAVKILDKFLSQIPTENISTKSLALRNKIFHYSKLIKAIYSP
jgi:DNA replication and repair protein RecF